MAVAALSGVRSSGEAPCVGVAKALFRPRRQRAGISPNLRRGPKAGNSTQIENNETVALTHEKPVSGSTDKKPWSDQHDRCGSSTFALALSVASGALIDYVP
jgi:hypothetical protein